MQNFSSHRPPRSAVYQPPPAPQPEAAFPEEHLAGFSPLLASLLSLTIKDGLCNKTAFHLLRDIYPYVSSPTGRPSTVFWKCSKSPGILLPAGRITASSPIP